MIDMNDTKEKDLANEPPSGRFVLRIDPDLHAVLRQGAKDAGISLNEFCARKLAVPSTDLPVGIQAAVRRAVDVLGSDIRGVVAFGSWARDDTVESSDIDLLIVASPERAIDRSLYRVWDQRPVEWAGRTIEPHFVHLPVEGVRVTGLWAEVALDGIVILDVDLSLSRRMSEIRTRIASGEMIRRWKDGYPYWVEVA
jgi:predicted nucleotidyltransferase